MRSAPASPRWATPRRSTGRARTLPRRSSPPFRSASRPHEHVAWIDAGGGQALWDELYAPFGAKPFMGGNTGVCMGGWFRRDIKSLADLRGLKIRSLGLGGEVFRRLGATPQTTPPAEILTSLQSGVIDGAEFVGPGTDIALGLYRVAPLYYGPGFNKPNGTGECIVSLKAWEALDSEFKAIVAHACAVEASFALAEMERLNAEALAALTTTHKVQLRTFPERSDRRRAQDGKRGVGRIGRAERARPQDPRLLHGVPRAHGRLVAHLDQGRAGRAAEGSCRAFFGDSAGVLPAVNDSRARFITS